MGFTLLGSAWVLWVLMGLSVVSIGIMVERALFLRSTVSNFDGAGSALLECLRSGDVEGAKGLLSPVSAPEAHVTLVGLEAMKDGRDVAFEAMSGAKVQVRMAMERRLGFLGTVGSNAPFIGLFGTVLGIIQAFADLAAAKSGGADVVMGGISEALVATAVGLLVAIPAVIGFNVFQGRVRAALGRVDALAHVVLAAAAASPKADRADGPNGGD